MSIGERQQGITHNGLQLAEVRDYGEQIFNLNTEL